MAETTATSPRPCAKAPLKIIDPHSNIDYDQDKLSVLMDVVPRSISKWLNEIILAELRPLFLRVRIIDRKNETLENFISTMFPKFFESNRQRANELAKHYRTTWSDWRHTLQKGIKERYEKYGKKDKTLTVAKMGESLETRHVTEIFRTWLSSIRGSPSDEVIEALRKVILVGFQGLKKEGDFRGGYSDRYTINLNVPSRSGFDIGSSLNIMTIDDDSTSDEDDDIRKKRRGSKSIQ